MKFSNLKIEQANKKGSIKIDYGEILNSKELSNIINKNFNCVKGKSYSSIGSYDNIKYCICFKNVSYLGTPHPIHKKRIQIPGSFIETYNENLRKEIKTFFIGVYQYKNHIIFVDFDTKNYINNKAHNSSAHVLTIDLINATLKGVYTKYDRFQNRITAFTAEHINEFLDFKLNGITLSYSDEIIEIFDNFYASLPKEWDGIACYNEMIDSNFNQRFQSEWAGFYLEFKLSKFINKMRLSKQIEYIQNKKNGDVDLDLYFPQKSSYGDLKAHSLHSSGIQGNDYQTILNIVKEHPIYYVVFNHETLKDSDNEYKVTFFWNKKLGKENLMSYSSKMKGKIYIKNYMILEINKSNLHYLSEFKQGKNSNGKPRKSKILINTRNIDNFIIHYNDSIYNGNL